MSIDPRFEKMERLRDRLVAMLRDWRRGLLPLFQESGLGDFGKSVPPVTVEFREADIALFRTDGNFRHELGRVARQDVGELDIIAALLAVAGDLPLHRRDVRLLFPGDQVLRPTLRLPVAPAGRLRKALHYELPRLSPLDPDQLYFDFSASTPDASHKKADIALRIIKRTPVDQAVAICHAAGLRIAAIGFGNDNRDADWQHFPVDHDAFAHHLWQRRGVPALCGLALVLMLVLVSAIYARGSARLDDLANRTEAERARAAIATHLERDLATAATQAQFLSQQKQGPMLVAALADVTRILPDGTWLTEFQMKGRTVRIQGYAPNASSLIALIDKSAAFADAHFEAPVMQSQTGNTERFDLSFKLNGKMTSSTGRRK